jgi:5S rRNA maturation endonuclease (ribonuclease M5)
MAEAKRGYINVDELIPQVSLEQAITFYGMHLPELHRIGAETRARCFLACGRVQETGDRALAIQEGHPAKQWACHQYGCGKSGNLVSLCDLIKPGENMGGRPRGQRFKDIAADLKAIVEGQPHSPVTPRPAVAPSAAPIPTSTVNVPLSESENERARSLVNLDAKFIIDPALMPPAAASYFRRRLFLTPEVCRQWRMGYLPRDVGGDDKSGGTMRGKIVYAYTDEEGNVLTWFGRDPEFEEKHRRWEAGDRSDREPEKFHFVKGFHRGTELFGQNGRERLQRPDYREKLKKLGVIVVEGPNDVIALDGLGVPAAGLCSNMVTDDQVAKISRWANELADGVVTLMLDCDPEGENGTKQALWKLAQSCYVRLAWSSEMYGGKFKGKQPEQLSAVDWGTFVGFLSRSRSGEALIFPDNNNRA